MKTTKEIIKKKIDGIKKSLMIGKMLESQAGKGAFNDIDEKEIFCIEILEEILNEINQKGKIKNGFYSKKKRGFILTDTG